MEFEFSGNRIVFSKELTDLDTFVIEIIKIFNRAGIRYAVISGYLAILFGRPRATEDVDVFIEEVPYATFKSLFDMLAEQGYEFLNSPDPEDLFYKYLKAAVSIRAARKNTVFPNMEIKVATTRFDKDSLEKPVVVEVSGHEIKTSSLELQIAFKLYLGTRKDIEDARFLFALFEDKVHREEIENYAGELGCREKLKFLGGDYAGRKNI